MTIVGLNESPDGKGGFGYAYLVVFCPDDRFKGEMRLRPKGSSTERGKEYNAAFGCWCM